MTADSDLPAAKSQATRRELTTIYQGRWWNEDVDAFEHVSASASVRDRLERLALVTTNDVYFDPATGLWSEPRRRLQLELAKTQIATRSSALRGPIVYFTIGPMGSGKTRVLRELVHAHRALAGLDPSTLSRIDADAVRVGLPEYRSGLGSMVVQSEAFDITYKDVYPMARDAGDDIVFDTIGTLDASGNVVFGEILDELVGLGFTPHVLRASAPLEVCRERVVQREGVEGRYIDPGLQASQFGQPEVALAQLLDRGLVRDWLVVDTTGPVESPVLKGAGGCWVEDFSAVFKRLHNRTH